MSEEADRRTNDVLRDLIENIEDHPFGIITQRGYAELQGQLKEQSDATQGDLKKQADKVEERFHRWLVTGLVAFGIIALGTTVALVGYGILLTKQGNITNDIQQQRYNTILDACLDQNERHDNVIKQIDKAVAAVPPPPSEQKKAREGAKPFKLILEAAVPHTKDCRAYAKDRTDGDIP